MIRIPLIVIMAFHVVFAIATAAGQGVGVVDSCGENVPRFICYGPFEGVLDRLDEGINLIEALLGGFQIMYTLWGILSMDYAILDQGGALGNITFIIKLAFGVTTFVAIVSTMVNLMGGRRLPGLGG